MDRLTSSSLHVEPLAALRQENALLNTLVEQVYSPAIAIIDPDSDFHFTFVNKAFCRLFQLDKVQLYQLQPWHINPEFNREYVVEQWMELRRKGTLRLEMTSHLEGQEPRLIEIIANDFSGPSPHKIIVYLRDITQEKAVQLEHAQQCIHSQTLHIEQQYHNVFSHMADDILLLELDENNDLRVVDINHSAAKHFPEHRTVKQYIGQKLVDLLPKENIDDLKQLQRECLSTKTTCHQYNIFCHLDHLYYDLTMTPLLDDHLEIKRVVVVKRDITDKILREQERRARSQELKASEMQLRRLTAHNEKVRENERKHIAREVHDEFGQRLTALKMGIQSLALQLPPSETSERLFSQLHDHLTETITFARHLVSRLRPGALDMGLMAALEWLVDDFRQRNPTCCYTLRHNHIDVEFDEDSAVAIFRIVQESLNNALKHSSADQVQITLHKEREQLSVIIKDNGCGFDPSQVHHDSFGLIGMKERVLNMSADLEVTSKPNVGTQITLTICHLDKESWE
ncbi:PAS domain-containing protein [Vibrio sp. CAIM 722]|uniref:PAS domain-containing protein n=1 Tax=Vibrio eleionomae TaxID=2653505 RepID=A0A7X4LN87_9VIBR|nr:PAS domain-containing protein [Vibrio eleionomae]MZI95088.1 PAS domain-containing protein [Vibrio eleionomae]